MHFYGGGTPAGHVGPGADWRNGRSGWHFFYNDCWLLGAAHALHDLNLASPRRRTNLWAAWGLTAMGREVAFLADHGYHFVKVGHQGLEVATCPRSQRRTARGATFASLVAAMQARTQQAQVMTLVDQAAG